MLTASIVLYNTPREQIYSVIKSVIDSKSIQTLYIIDNSLNDKYRILEKEFTSSDLQIRYIHNANIGYGASHNIAIEEAIVNNSVYHIVLNPDIIFESNVLPTLISYMDSNPTVGYILPRVIYPNGELQFLCKLLPTPFDLIFRRFLPKTKIIRKKIDKYELKQFGYDKIINPPCLSGCFMFMRVSILKENKLLFDDRYFMYCEDFDLIRRIHKVSKTIFYPYVTIIHNHAKESYKNRKMLFTHIKSAIRYFNKYGWFIDKERRAMNKTILSEIRQ